MEIKDIEILIECKRLVERLLRGERYILNKLEERGKDTQVVQGKIKMMERALDGKPFEIPEEISKIIKENVEGV